MPRSSHLGYDCYLCGPLELKQYIRCVAREHRLPPYISAEIRPHLPREIHWPEGNHAAAHVCIDAIFSMDVALLAAWKQDFPGHTFGFEPFLTWARGAVRIGKRARALLRGAAPETPSFRHRGVITKRTPIIDQDVDYDCTAEYAQVRFKDGTHAIQVTIRSPTGLGLSKVFVDLVDSSYDVEVHFPGRYDAEGVPVHLLKTLLGISGKVVHRRRANEGYMTEGETHADVVAKRRKPDIAQVQQEVFGTQNARSFDDPSPEPIHG